MKKLLLTSILMILFAATLFAGGGYENVLLYQPTNVPNNQGRMIELSSAKSMQASDFKNAINDVFESSFSNDLPLFCIIDTLNYNDSNVNNKTNIEMTITSKFGDGFYFVKDGNDTIREKFTLEAFIIEFTSRAGLFTVNFNNTERKSFSGEITLTESISGNKQKTSFSSSGMNQYILSMPATKYTNLWGGNYPDYPRYYYICVKIAGNNNLEDGEYTATMYLDCERMGLINTPITIKGYVGEKPTTITTDTHSFFVNNGSDSFFTNLSVQKGHDSPPLEIAKLQFYYSTDSYVADSDPSPAERQPKIKIYISPKATYTDPGDYVFRRTGTENQSDTDNFANRVFYELDTVKTTGLTQYSGNTYYLLPDYDFTKLKTTWSGSTYLETWQLNNKQIFILISEDSKEILTPAEGQEKHMHETGTYSSYIYFTVESTV